MSDASDHINIELLTRYFANECSDAERAEVEHWRDSSEAAASEFWKFERLWKIAEEPEVVTTTEPSEAARQALANVNQMIADTEPLSLKKVRRPLYAVAAAIAVLLSVYFLSNLLTDDPAIPMVFSSNTGTFDHNLPDGTNITLNAGSKIEYPSYFKDNVREVTLTGEAYFDVNRDTTRPFIIHAGGANITVLGTSFTVSEEDDDVLVTVNTGKVKVADGNEESDHVILVAGESGKFDRTADKTEKLEHSDPRKTLWATGTLSFKNAELGQAFYILSDIYNVKIEAANPTLLDCRLTASFTDESIDEIMRVIAITFDSQVQRQENQFVFTGGGCN